MTIIQETAPTVTTLCPPWCSEHLPGSFMIDGEVETPVHLHPVGTLGVAVQQTGDDQPVVYLPELPIDNMMAPADYARQLAAELIVAAGLIEAAKVSASTTCPEGLPWCTDHASEPLEPEGWHRRYVGDSGAHICQEDGKFTLYPAPLSPNGDITADEMRQAAADMIVAAGMFEGMTA